MLRIRRHRSDDSDEALLARYRASGDLEVLGQLFSRYTELVYGVCLKYLPDEATAEDAAMAIFEELIYKARTHEVSAFRGWLYVLTRNHCLMQLRRESRHPVQNIEPERMQSVDLRHHTLDEAPDNGREAALSECLERLSAPQRRCIQLFYYEGRSYQEIAGLLSERLGQVRSHIQNGRRNLRNCVEARENDPSLTPGRGGSPGQTEE